MTEIIPAIDLLDQKVVRLRQGNYEVNRAEYQGSPFEWANYWKSKGAQRVHVIDLNGAKDGIIKNLRGLEEIISTGLKVQFGGGIRSWEDLENLFEIGVNQAILGTAAVKNKDLIIQSLKVYRDRIILALDAKANKIVTEGWIKNSSLSIEELLSELEKLGLKRYIYTDINKDGTLSGPNLKNSFYLMKTFSNIKCIISGGVGSIKDLLEIKEHNKTNNNNNLEGIICGKSLYEKSFLLEEALQVFAS